MMPQVEVEPAPAPQANPDLIGHDAAESVLARAVEGGRLPHAWLITGAKGVGKATLAYRFARFLLAEAAGDPAQAALFGTDAPARTLDLDPKHPVFRRVAAGAHADLLSVRRGLDPKSGRRRREIIAEDARGAARFFHKTAAEGGWRIAIVDSIDEMNRHGANAILKILEEPPARSLLILVSHAPGGILPTIRSRCTVLPLQRLADGQVAAVLSRHGQDLTAEQARRLAGLADGSPGRALALADAGGLELYETMISLLTRLPRLDVAAVHAFTDKVARGGGAAETFATLSDLLIWWLARLVLAGAGAGEGAGEGAHRDIVAGDVALIQRLAGDGSLDRWAELWEKSARLFAQADAVKLDRKQVLLGAFFDIQAAAQA